MSVIITDSQGNKRTQLTRDDYNYSAGSNYGQPKTSASYSSSGSSATQSASNPSPAVQSSPVTNLLQSDTNNNNVNVVVKDKYGYSTYNTQPNKIQSLLSDNNGTLVSTLPGNAKPSDINRAITGDVGRVNRGSGGGTYYSKAQFPGVASGSDSPLLVVSNSQEERANASSLTSGQLQSGEKSVWLSPGNELIPSSGNNAPYGLSARAASDRGFKKISNTDLTFSPGKISYNPIFDNQKTAPGYTAMSGEDYIKNFVKSDRGAYIDTLNQRSVNSSELENMKQSSWQVPTNAVNLNDIFNKYFGNTTIYGRKSSEISKDWGFDITGKLSSGVVSGSQSKTTSAGDMVVSAGRSYMDLSGQWYNKLNELITETPKFGEKIGNQTKENGVLGFAKDWGTDLIGIPLSLASGAGKSTASFIGDMERIRTPIASKIYGANNVEAINSGFNSALARLDTAFKTKGELELKPEGYAMVSAAKTSYATPLPTLMTTDSDAQAFGITSGAVALAATLPITGPAMAWGFGGLAVGEAVIYPTPKNLAYASLPLAFGGAKAVKYVNENVATVASRELTIPQGTGDFGVKLYGIETAKGKGQVLFSKSSEGWKLGTPDVSQKLLSMPTTTEIKLGSALETSTIFKGLNALGESSTTRAKEIIPVSQNIMGSTLKTDSKFIDENQLGAATERLPKAGVNEFINIAKENNGVLFGSKARDFQLAREYNINGVSYTLNKTPRDVEFRFDALGEGGLQKVTAESVSRLQKLGTINENGVKFELGTAREIKDTPFAVEAKVGGNYMKVAEFKGKDTILNDIEDVPEFVAGFRKVGKPMTLGNGLKSTRLNEELRGVSQGVLRARTVKENGRTLVDIFPSPKRTKDIGSVSVSARTLEMSKPSKSLRGNIEKWESYFPEELVREQVKLSLNNPSRKVIADYSGRSTSSFGNSGSLASLTRLANSSNYGSLYGRMSSGNSYASASASRSESLSAKSLYGLSKSSSLSSKSFSKSASFSPAKYYPKSLTPSYKSGTYNYKSNSKSFSPERYSSKSLSSSLSYLGSSSVPRLTEKPYNFQGSDSKTPKSLFNFDSSRGKEKGSMVLKPMGRNELNRHFDKITALLR